MPVGHGTEDNGRWRASEGKGIRSRTVGACGVRIAGVDAPAMAGDEESLAMGAAEKKMEGGWGLFAACRCATPPRRY